MIASNAKTVATDRQCSSGCLRLRLQKWHGVCFTCWCNINIAHMLHNQSICNCAKYLSVHSSQTLFFLINPKICKHAFYVFAHLHCLIHCCCVSVWLFGNINNDGFGTLFEWLQCDLSSGAHLLCQLKASHAYGNMCCVMYLVDPASSHMLVSKIKPCMSKCKCFDCEAANGSLEQL